MIRLAALDDLGVLQEMCKSFFDASGYSKDTIYNESDVHDLLVNLIENDWLLTDGESGMLGFVIFPMIMNRAHLMAQELFWWVNEDKRGSSLGISLLSSAEKLAKEHGAKTMLMLSLNDLAGEKVNKLYRSRGYVPRESVYMRAL